MTASSTGEDDPAMNEPQHGLAEGGGTRQGGQNGSGPRPEPATELAPAAEVERFSVVVIGGGQTGLAAGYELAQRGIDFVVLESGSRLGETWRPRWDPRRVFTPARYDGLPGLPYQGDERTYPTQEQLADYLEEYAERFGIPVRLGSHVLGLTSSGRGHVLVECADGSIMADQVIVATDVHATQPRPSDALDPRLIELRRGEYRSLSQLQGFLILG